LVGEAKAKVHLDWCALGGLQHIDRWKKAKREREIKGKVVPMSPCTNRGSG